MKEKLSMLAGALGAEGMTYVRFAFYCKLIIGVLGFTHTPNAGIALLTMAASPFILYSKSKDEYKGAPLWGLLPLAPIISGTSVYAVAEGTERLVNAVSSLVN